MLVMITPMIQELPPVHGRNLLRICDYIGLRRMQWIRQADRDFRAADDVESSEPIITRIEVTDWMRLEPKAPDGQQE
jgi:hypothetical protein